MVRKRRYVRSRLKSPMVSKRRYVVHAIVGCVVQKVPHHPTYSVSFKRWAYSTVGELQIICVADECVLLFRTLVLVRVNEFKGRQSGAKISHIRMCSHVSQDLSVALASELGGSCLHLNVGNTVYICFSPNHLALF